MDVLDGMRAFRAVVDSGSFVGAARSLSLTTAWVSKRVSQLEAHLGVQLLVRTTRRVALTDAGRVYFESCARLIDEIDASERSVVDLQASPRGRLRITAPMSFGLIRIAPLLPDLHAQYPDIELDVAFDDRYVDLLEESVDVAIRVGTALDDSSLLARKLASGRRLLCASPGYLRKQGTPRHPRDLAKHVCLRYALHAAPGTWTFDGPNGEVTVHVGGRLRLNNSIALGIAAVAGVGILLTPDFVVEEDLAAGRLQALLPRYRPSGYSVFAVSPPTRFATPKVRAFVEFLAQRLGRASA